jgi:membrane-bound inhibitor of C-type lysozyme
MRRPNRRASAAAAAAGLVGLCACAADEASAPPVVAFVCPGGTVLRAHFYPAENRVHLEVGGRTYDLPQLISASGARYGNGGVTFWNKGREALFERFDGPSYAGCVARDA